MVTYEGEVPTFLSSTTFLEKEVRIMIHTVVGGMDGSGKTRGSLTEVRR